MRILKLRFRNLNSLAGDWEIDFTHPSYVSSGIFAITGPTGAGKSTILDGICLSLYGQTPRLSRITQSENEIMSRQTGDCSAEVEFETGKGRFRCHWSQHRSRRQADGLLQSPRHEIVDVASGIVLESKLKAVSVKVEEVTGMDFDRFTRSMLLAQGGFAAFLQATPDKRAPILEQITGTIIYSRISLKVHELTTEERKKLEAMRSDLNGLQLLSPEEEVVLRQELAQKEQEEVDLARVAGEIHEQKVWRERIQALESEIVQLEQAENSFQVKKEAAAPHLEQLDRGRQALSLEREYSSLLGIRTLQKAEQTELTRGEERLPLLRQKDRDGVVALEKAETALQTSRTEQAAEGELIRKSRELDVKLREIQAHIQRVAGERDKLRKQDDDCRARCAKCEAEMDATGAALQSVELFLAQHRADAGLAEALSGVEQQVKALKVLGGQRNDRQKQLERQGALCGKGEQVTQQSELVWQEAGQRVAGAEDRLGKVHLLMKSLLQGRLLFVWRGEAEALTTRFNRLQILQERASQVVKNRERVDSLTLRQETLDARRQELFLQEEALTGERELRDEMVRQLREKVVLLNRVRDLEEERMQLLDGAPCPLCGALEHPYAMGNAPSADATARELERAGLAAKESGERLSGIRVEQAGILKELEQTLRERDEYQENVARDELFCDHAMAELQLIAALAERPEVVRSAAESCRESLDRCRRVIGEAQLAEEEEREAKADYDKARELLAREDAARQAVALRLESAQNERVRLQRECATLQDELDRALADVERLLEEYGCRDISLQNVEEFLGALTKRRAVHGERLQEKERLARMLADLGGELQKQRALLAEVQRNCGEREELLREMLAQRDELAGSRQELFGERNPDHEERRLADAVKEAGERRDHAWQEQNRLRTEMAGVVEEIRKRTESVKIRAEELARLELFFQQKLTEVGFTDEALFVQARLTKVRFDELARLDETLRREETEIRTRWQDRLSAVHLEREKRLSDKSLEEIVVENGAVTLRLSELQKGLGGLNQQLRQHDELLVLQQNRLQVLELQKKECARWERLHELIGSSDGKKFRNFAQGLTFEVMVSHANRQLQKMSDRYILARDVSEPLELNVIDNYQAGEIRSTKNLSGGESFIVSLALALGLSTMASRTVRVDSLFLDEGFGTLDEDALETALETLSGLPQEGKLIGIISHVPALKERIGTQIQVDVGNGGRSSLSGPGCRQVKSGVH
jgi:DNA repair protein SbcC/Rad50